MSKYKTGVLVLFFAILIAFTIFVYLPVIDGLSISFTDWNGLSFDRNYVGFDNYVNLVRDRRFGETMLITLRYTVTIVIGTIGLGYFVSLLLLQMKKQNVYLSVLFFPHLLMSVVGCILWEQIYNGFLPSIGKSLGLSLIRRNLLAQKDTAILAVAIADLWRLVPYAILLIFTSLKAVSSDLIDTAEMEGANKFQILWHVQLPQTLSTLGIILTTAVTHGLTAIDTILIMTGGGPARATETLYFVVYKNSFMRQKFGYGLAQGVILALLSVLIFVLIDMTLNRKRMDGVEIV